MNNDKSLKKSEAATLIQSFFRGNKEKQKYSLNQLKNNELESYRALIIGNDPDMLLELQHHKVADRKVALIGCSGLRSLTIAAFLGTIANIPKLFIIDNSQQVYSFWYSLREFFSNEALAKTEWLFFSNLDRFIESTIPLSRNFTNKGYEVGTMEDQDIWNCFQNLFNYHSFGYIRQIVLHATFLKQTWENTQVFNAIKNTTDYLNIDTTYVYSSNILSFVDNDDSKNKILRNINFLKPSIHIVTNTCEQHGHPERVKFIEGNQTKKNVYYNESTCIEYEDNFGHRHCEVPTPLLPRLIELDYCSNPELTEVWRDTIENGYHLAYLLSHLALQDRKEFLKSIEPSIHRIISDSRQFEAVLVALPIPLRIELIAMDFVKGLITDGYSLGLVFNRFPVESWSNIAVEFKDIIRTQEDIECVLSRLPLILWRIFLFDLRIPSIDNFDSTILKNIFRKCLVKIPSKYWSERDIRAVVSNAHELSEFINGMHTLNFSQKYRNFFKIIEPYCKTIFNSIYDILYVLRETNTCIHPNIFSLTTPFLGTFIINLESLILFYDVINQSRKSLIYSYDRSFIAALSLEELTDGLKKLPNKSRVNYILQELGGEKLCELITSFRELEVFRESIKFDNLIEFVKFFSNDITIFFKNENDIKAFTSIKPTTIYLQNSHYFGQILFKMPPHLQLSLIQSLNDTIIAHKVIRQPNDLLDLLNPANTKRDELLECLNINFLSQLITTPKMFTEVSSTLSEQSQLKLIDNLQKTLHTLIDEDNVVTLILLLQGKGLGFQDNERLISILSKISQQRIISVVIEIVRASHRINLDKNFIIWIVSKIGYIKNSNFYIRLLKNSIHRIEFVKTDIPLILNHLPPKKSILFLLMLTPQNFQALSTEVYDKWFKNIFKQVSKARSLAQATTFQNEIVTVRDILTSYCQFSLFRNHHHKPTVKQILQTNFDDKNLLDSCIGFVVRNTNINQHGTFLALVILLDLEFSEDKSSVPHNNRLYLD